MSMSFRVAAFPMILMTALSACVGGGSVAGGGPLPQVVMDVNDPASTVTLTHDDGNLSGIGISTPRSSLSFGPDEISERFDAESGHRTAYRGENETSLAVVVDPAFFGWNYQSFGVWLKDLNTNPFQAGAVSFGDHVSPASALPTGLTDARFSGHAGGFYFDGAGNRYATDAQMNAITDFKNRNIQFSTTGTLLTNMGTNARTSNDGLDLRGSWTYAPGTSQFSGSVNTVNNGLQGSAAGRFYGPSAEEIGGTYGLTGGGASMLGGFGGKR